MTRGTAAATLATWAYGYDPKTLGRTVVVDPNGNQTVSTFDASGDLLTTTDPMGRETIKAYDALGDVTSITDPRGTTTTLSYDARGNLTGTSTPWVEQSTTITTTNFHDDALHPGDVTRTRDADGKTATFTYDQYGYRQTATDPLGNRTITCHNSLGWPTWTVAARGTTGLTPATVCAQSLIVPTPTPPAYTTQYDYSDLRTGGTNEFGAPGRITDAEARVTTREYDADGQVIQGTDATGSNTTVYKYDAAHRLYETDRADHSAVLTHYFDDGTMKDQVDAAGNTTTYGYDALKRVVSMTTPATPTCAAPCVSSSTYDALGNRLTSTDDAGHVTTYGYDADGELTGIAYGDGGATGDVSGVVYDADGRRTSMTDGTGTSTWVYDSLGHLVSSTNGYGQAVGYGYDAKGQTTSLTHPGNRVVTRGYDDAGRLVSVTDWQGHTTSFTPDADGNVQSELYANGITAAMTYDHTDSLTAIGDTPTPGTLGQAFSFSYGRDADHRISSVTSGGAAPSDNHSYGYTGLSQVATVDSGRYRYDTADNLTGLTDGTTQQFNAADQITGRGLISLVETVPLARPAPTSQTETLTLPTAATKNDLIVVTSTQASTSTSVASVTDSAGGTYTQVGTGVTSAGTAPDSTVVYRRVAAGGESSATVTYSGLGPRAVVVAVYRGVDTGTPVDGVATAAAPSAGASSLSPQLASTSLPGDRLVLLQGVAGNTSAQSWSAPGMTEVSQANKQLVGIGLADQMVPYTIPASGDNGTRTATLSASGQITATLVALRPAQTQYAYDANGNRTAVTLPNGGGTTALQYDRANRLVADGGAATYTYNGDGLRMSKTVGATTLHFAWQQSGSLPLLLDDGSTSYVYGPGGAPIEQLTSAVAISAVGTPLAKSDTTASTLTLSLPAGTQAGDQIILATTFAGGLNQSNTVQTPGGFTAVAAPSSGGTGPTADRTSVFRRTAVAGDTGVTLTYSGNFPKSAVVAVYRGVDPSAAVDVKPTGVNPSGTTVAASTSTHYPGEELVALQGATYAGLGPQTWSAPATMHEEVSSDATTTTIGLADAAQASSGATGVETSTFSTSGQLTTVLLGLAPRPSVLFLHQDQIGSTRVLTDIAGAPRATYTYDAYGRLLQSSGDQTTAFGYAGQYTDVETGLVYLRARYYEPATAQFLSRDPLTARTRLPYGYAADDPLNRTDKSGMNPCSGEDCDASTRMMNAVGQDLSSLSDAALSNLSDGWQAQHQQCSTNGWAAATVVDPYATINIDREHAREDVLRASLLAQRGSGGGFDLGAFLGGRFGALEDVGWGLAATGVGGYLVYVGVSAGAVGVGVAAVGVAAVAAGAYLVARGIIDLIGGD